MNVGPSWDSAEESQHYPNNFISLERQNTGKVKFLKGSLSLSLF